MSPHETGLLGAGRESDAPRFPHSTSQAPPGSQRALWRCHPPRPLSVRPRGRRAELRAAAAQEPEPEREQVGLSARAAAGGAPQAPALLPPAQVLRSACRRRTSAPCHGPIPPLAPSPPRPGLPEPLRLPAAAAPVPARPRIQVRRPRSGSGDPERTGDGAGSRWDGEGTGDEEGPAEMGKRLENGEGAPVGASPCAPGACVSAAQCLQPPGRPCVRAPAPVCPCVSECPRAVERLGVLYVHVSVSVEYFCVHARPGGMCVYS